MNCEKCFLIGVYGQYVNGADKISHIMGKKAKTTKKTYAV